ncbi:ZIP family metal transporter [Candidatus Gribaldobacteria bacterium]|nr:ZIP family metal transporter [Candidatus Gribaldobacteria bacterium]
MIFAIFLAVFIISLASFIGALFLVFKSKIKQDGLLLLVALSAGALLGGAFLELLPETLELIGPKTAFLIVLVAFFFFFILEKIFHWRHCHKANCQVHSFGYLNLVGDGLHNFLDGLLIAVAFLTNWQLGLSVSLAVLLHEIPQEIGDLAVLLYSGFKAKKALLFNFLTALTAFFGALFGILLSYSVYNFLLYLVLPFSAGGFIYIALSDLLPEIRKTQTLSYFLKTSLFLLLGCLLITLPHFFGLNH